MKVNDQFHDLTVMSVPAPCRWSSQVECRCKCGQVKLVPAYNLRKGIAKSCGCRRAEVARQQFTKHGLCQTAEYRVYRHMLRRCLDSSRKDYPNYGGRGITVCDRWKESFTQFLQDVGPRPSKSHSLDRLDPDGPYDPQNCRWATRSEQNNNTRRNRYITHQGRKRTLAQWGAEMHLKPHTIRKRLVAGWSVSDALTLPPDSTRRLLVSQDAA